MHAGKQTERLTMAQALVKWLCAQDVQTESGVKPLFPGLFGIFGHGNVTCLAEALERVQDRLPTWRGQNEQSMALAGIAYAKAKRAEQIMIASSSIGPGATNMVTAAGVAMSNRLPILLLGGDTFQNRRPDPVLQQVEHFGDPSTTVNDCFKPVVRYWDRITHGEQLMQSLPQAVQTMLNPATRGPAFIGLPQDTQALAYDYPAEFFESRVWHIPRQRPDAATLEQAIDFLSKAKKPLIIAGGGVLYSRAESVLNDFAERRNIPISETTAGKSSVLGESRFGMGCIGVIGSTAANILAEEADVVLAIGTRLQDFTTGSGSVFANSDMKLISINAGAFDAHKRHSLAVVGDAKACLEELDQALGAYAAPDSWMAQADDARADWMAYLETRKAPTNDVPTYGQVVATINELAGPHDRALTAAGGLPGEMNKGWMSKSYGSYDLEFGFSCMGYEVAGGWGAAMALADEGNGGDQIVMVGDGSYMMMNSDIYSSVLSGHKMIVVICDNGGYAVINRLQNYKGGESFNNLIKDCRVKEPFMPDFAQHAQSMGANGEKVSSIADLREAFARAKAADKTSVIHIETYGFDWTGGDAWWDVGVPEVSPRPQVQEALKEHEEKRKRQRPNV